MRPSTVSNPLSWRDKTARKLKRTLRLSPSLLDSMVSVGLMPLEDLGSLLDDGDGGGHFCDRKKDAVRQSFLRLICTGPS